MENEINDDIMTSENNDDIVLEEEQEEAPKPQPESPEAKLARLKRQTTQLEKKLGVAPEKPAKVTKEAKSSEVDYGLLTYLEAKGITSDEDMEWAKQVKEETGKDWKELLSSKYFQAELKERKEARITQEAVPSGTKRVGNSAKDTVEYWINKGPGNLPDDVELRRKVVNERMRIENGSNNQFSPRPIGGILGR